MSMWLRRPSIVSTSASSGPRRDREERRRTVARREEEEGQGDGTRFKGLGEIEPQAVAGTPWIPNTRRLVQLTSMGAEGAEGEDGDETLQLMDMLLAKAPVIAANG